MNAIRHDRRGSPWRLAVAGTLGVVTFAACDFEVSNPGPVQDQFLDDPAGHAALVNGSGRALSEALNYLAYTGGVAALELQGSGNITNHGVTLLQRQGVLSPNGQETDDHWDIAQRARWVAEEAVRRIEAAGTPDPALAARAALYAGYANRLLGENMCVGVIDGGAAQPRAIYLERAHEQFSDAISLAGQANNAELLNAARAGRASARAWQGNWTGAVEDAQAVPAEFAYNAKFGDLDEQQHNRIYWAGANSPFRAATVWSTFFEGYYETTKDPRTPWVFDPKLPVGDGSKIKFIRQLKYTSRTSPMRLSSEDEMQLLKAEALLRQSNWQGALTILNQLRAEASLPAAAAAGLEETWRQLKLERAAELWIEGRALNDAYRYAKENTPGAPVQSLSGRDKCFPIGETEINTNPNISGPTG